MRPILIVDDSAEDRMFAQRVFQECRILNPLVFLHGGRQCLDYFAKARPEEWPALVMLDLAMPEPNGVKVLQELCGGPAGVNTIFVMLSGLQDVREIRGGYLAGARTFLIKPLSNYDLMEVVEGLKGIRVAKGKGGYVLMAAG